MAPGIGRAGVHVFELLAGVRERPSLAGEGRKALWSSGVEAALLTLLLLASAFLRFYRLESVPPGLFGDVATNGLDARQLLAGHLSLFFPNNQGREPLFLYFQALLMAFGGVHPIVFTFSSVVMAMLTIALTYRLFRLQLGWPVALLAAALLSFSFWFVDMSRQGLRTTALPPLLLLSLYFEWRLLRSGKRRDALLAGLALGLSLYTYIAARLLPPLMVLLALAHWSVARKRVRRLGLAALVAAAVFLPEAAYFAAHANEAIFRAGRVSVFSSDPQAELFIDTPLESLRNTAQMFFIRGDPNLRYNIPYRPLFDPIWAAFFVLGLAIALWRGRRLAEYRWLVIWLVVMCIPSAVSNDSPDTFRVLAAAPAVFVFPAIALAGIARLHRFLWGAATLLLLLFGAQTFQLYFGQWAHDVRTYDWFGGRQLAIAGFLHARTEPVWFVSDDAGPAIRLLVPRTATDGWVRETSQIVPLPSSPRDTLYVAVQTATLFQLTGSGLAGLQPLGGTMGMSGKPDFAAFRWPAQAVASFESALQPAEVDQAGQFRLIGYRVAQNTGRVTLTLLWKQLQPAGPYDVFVHLVDKDGRQVSQSDLMVWPVQHYPGSTDLEAGPASSDEFITLHTVSASPGSYVAEVGINRRSASNPDRLLGGALAPPFRIEVRLN